jgi:hypothetical protein
LPHPLHFALLAAVSYIDNDATVTQKFRSKEALAKFLEAKELCFVVSADPKKFERIGTVEEALDKIKAEVPLIVHVSTKDDVSNLKRYVKNTATSLEVTTNLAIVGNETLLAEFGELKLINGGQGVLVENKETGREFDIDGLVKNSIVILLNETKSRLHPDDVGTILDRKKSLETAIMDPDAYTTIPDGVLYELAGLRVVAIASTNGCAKNAKEVCAAEGIHVVEPDGSGYKVTIHNKPPVA